MDNELESIKAWLAAQGLPTTVDGPGGLSGLEVQIVSSTPYPRPVAPTWASEVEAESATMTFHQLDPPEEWGRLTESGVLTAPWVDVEIGTASSTPGRDLPTVWRGPITIRMGDMVAPTAEVEMADGSVFRSKDDGKTWTRVEPEPSKPEPIDLDTMEAWELVRLECWEPGHPSDSWERWPHEHYQNFQQETPARFLDRESTVTDGLLWRFVDRKTGEVLATTEPAAGEES